MRLRDVNISIQAYVVENTSLTGSDSQVTGWGADLSAVGNVKGDPWVELSATGQTPDQAYLNLLATMRNHGLEF